MLPVNVGKDHSHGLLRGRSGGKRPGPATLWADYFPAAAEAAFPSRDKIVGPLRSFAKASALRCTSGAGPVRLPPSSP